MIAHHPRNMGQWCDKTEMKTHDKNRLKWILHLRVTLQLLVACFLVKKSVKIRINFSSNIKMNQHNLVAAIVYTELLLSSKTEMIDFKPNIFTM